MQDVPALAAELVARKPDVLFGESTPVVRALKQATAKIPIVTIASDPLGSGIVTNLAHPEANVTGLAPMSFELAASVPAAEGYFTAIISIGVDLSH